MRMWKCITMTTKKEILDALYDCFWQECWYDTYRNVHKFDNKCMTCYELASYILAKEGYLKSVNGRLYVSIKNDTRN